MSLTYRTPGVYVEWLDFNPQHLQLRRTDVAGFVGIAARGPVQAPTKIASPRQFLTTFGDPIAAAYLAYAVQGFFANGGRTCWVVRVGDPRTAVPARLRVLLPGRTPFVVEATSPGAWGNAITLEPVWGPDQVTGLIAREGDREQRIDLPSVAPSADSGPRIQTNLLGVSDALLPELTEDGIVTFVPDDYSVPSPPIDADTMTVNLAGGVDGVVTLTPEHFTGNPGTGGSWGVSALERVDGVSFVAAPDLMAGQLAAGQTPAFPPFDPAAIRDAQIDIITSCMAHRDRIAILDLPPVGRNAALTYRQGFPATSFAALYHPWIIVDDPLRLHGNVRPIPPSGHVAGMFARTDRLRGVHKPPANELLEGVWDTTEAIDQDAHGDLNEASINAIRAIPGRGILVLGARTLAEDVRWRYVNIRRLFAMIEDVLEEQMQWVTFEPNNPQLWKDIDRTVRGFLEQLFRADVLDGKTSDEAYFVRCDETTNPPSETDDGRVTCLIGFQPPYPAEFVVVRIGVTHSGIQVEEKGAQDV